ncbi:hypothetical protein [Pseudomonas caricapapayae]|uniref:hypothetical protein n=1 Tax=Pseudomonas caricapapayae TaxID=46678 RepID=UPI000EFE1428|nr:hypothetical protein [Pseudomonas caricapapayae]
MNLNHYTSITQFQMISRTVLRTGKYFSEHHGVLPAVWFTTSENAEGHGLPDGSEMSKVEIDIVKSRGENPKNNFSTNKKSIKIVVDSAQLRPFNKKRPEAGGLISFLDFSKFLGETPEYRRKLAVRGFYTSLPDVNNAEILRLSKELNTKEKTWYVYLGEDIPVEKISRVEGMSNGTYSEFDFDLHARPALNELGFFPVSEGMYEELAGLWGELPRFQYPVVSCICKSPEDIPSVQFMGRSTAWRISINEPAVLPDPGHRAPVNVEEFVKVVESHHSELMQLWEEASESYYTFYPENRPS